VSYKDIKSFEAENKELKEILQRVVHYIEYFKVLEAGPISWGSDDSTMGHAREWIKKAKEACK
jgi:hypothetical protein